MLAVAIVGSLIWLDRHVAFSALVLSHSDAPQFRTLDGLTTVFLPDWVSPVRVSLVQAYPRWSGLDPRARGPLLSLIHPGRVTFSLESRPESAGLHLPEPGSRTTAAVDLYVGDLTETQIHQLLDNLGEVGFAAWYRIPGRDGWPSRYGPHVHAVYAGVPMKAGLRAQVRDYLKGDNGLKNHQRYLFHTYAPSAVATVRQLYFEGYARR